MQKGFMLLRMALNKLIMPLNLLMISKNILRKYKLESDAIVKLEVLE